MNPLQSPPRASLPPPLLLPPGTATGAALLGGCGFQLRRAAPLRFGRIALQGFEPRSPMAAMLGRAVQAGGSQVVETSDQADVVLRVTTDLREQLVASTTGVGQVRTITLRTRLRFSLTTPDELRVLIPDTELIQVRDMSFDEKWALGKQLEVEQLYRVMQADIVDQVMNRLAAVSLATPAPAPEPASDAAPR